MRKNSVCIAGEIDESTFLTLFNDIKNMDLKKNPFLDVYITSEGGDALMGAAIGKYLQTLDVTTKAIGISCVASAATDIFLRCDKRYLPSGTQFMIHNTSYSVSGSSPDIREYMKVHVPYEKEYVKLLASFNDKPYTWWLNYLSKDRYLTIKECKHWGFVNEG